MSLDKINKHNVSDFYDHRNRYMVNDINTIVSFYRLGDREEIEPLDIVRVNFLLKTKILSLKDIGVLKKNIVISDKYKCHNNVLGYNGIGLDSFGNKLKVNYNNSVPNVNIKNKIFPAIYYRWKQFPAVRKEINEFVDLRYLIGILNANKNTFKMTIDLFEQENLFFNLN